MKTLTVLKMFQQLVIFYDSPKEIVLIK